MAVSAGIAGQPTIASKSTALSTASINSVVAGSTLTAIQCLVRTAPRSSYQILAFRPAAPSLRAAKRGTGLAQGGPQIADTRNAAARRTGVARRARPSARTRPPWAGTPVRM